MKWPLLSLTMLGVIPAGAETPQAAFERVSDLSNREFEVTTYLNPGIETSVATTGVNPGETENPQMIDHCRPYFASHFDSGIFEGELAVIQFDFSIEIKSGGENPAREHMEIYFLPEDQFFHGFSVDWIRETSTDQPILRMTDASSFAVGSTGVGKGLLYQPETEAVLILLDPRIRDSFSEAMLDLLASCQEFAGRS